MFTSRVSQIRLRAKLTRRLIGQVSRLTALVSLLFIVLATTLYSGSSASSSRAALPGQLFDSRARAGKSIVGEGGPQLPNAGGTANLLGLLGFLMPTPQNPLPLSETVTTYAPDCSTPKSAFNFGDTVCAKIEGGPPLLVAPRRFSWVTPDNIVQSRTTVTTLGQTDLFEIPARDPNKDYRELWRVNSISPRSSVRASAFFTVSDPAAPAANLSIYDNINSAEVSTGSEIEFALWIVNRGPDPATDVVVTSAATNATFASATQDIGPTFTCATASGVTTCTIATLPAGTKSRIAVRYGVLAGATAGTVITNTAEISSSTADQHGDDNASIAKAVIASVTDPTACQLSCPGNITRAANTSQNTLAGALVTFAADISGNCGTVSSSPASGTFFPVGDTTVTVNSSSGQSCTFVVTITDTAAPTITCPANVQKNAGGDCSVEVTAAELGSPTATGNQVTVDGDRSDGRQLDAPYSTGTTTITWTARDAEGRTATCNQTVNVTGTDTTAPTITAPANVTETTGGSATSCGKIVGESEIGTPETADNCSSVTVTRTGVPAGNFFPIGTTTITYIATDGSGNAAAPVTQTVTISDDAPPIIKAPADASYTCRSEVPAANAAQATRGDTFDAGNLLPPAPPSDNCGVPTVTVSESDNGGAGSASNPLIITRTFTATDAANNRASDVQTITVADGTAPTVAAPAAVTLYTGAGATSCGVNVSDLEGTLGTATANDNCSGVTVARSGVPSGNNFPVGATTVTYTATDAGGNTASATQQVTVIDNTAPTITAPAAVLLYTGAGATSCDVTVNDLDVALGTATANDNCPGVTVARGGGNVFPLGQTVVTYKATDAHGNTASATQQVTVVDNTPPTITAPANITVQLPLNSTATSMAVSYPNPATAADNCAGTITIGYSPASGSVFSVGTTTVTATATDAHGNSSSATFTVTVLYNFTGFFSPVSNLPTLNMINAGRAIPVKFSLSGNKGLNIFAANSPYTVAINCDGSLPSAEVVETVTAGASSLSYGPDQYNYVWKTETSWAGACRQLVVTLNDGSVHRANFKFR